MPWVYLLMPLGLGSRGSSHTQCSSCRLCCQLIKEIWMHSISLPTSSWAQWYESPWTATGFTLREWQWAAWRLAPLASTGQLQTMMFWGVSTDGWLVRSIEIRIFFDLAKWYSDETVKDMMPHQTQTNSALSLLLYHCSPQKKCCFLIVIQVLEFLLCFDAPKNRIRSQDDHPAVTISSVSWAQQPTLEADVSQQNESENKSENNYIILHITII